MTTAWFLMMVLASPMQGTFYPAQVMEKSFASERACYDYAKANPDKIDFTNGGKADPSIKVGVVCVKGWVR